tara:strand:+ start:5665 stop:6270 length:606 start_codon:yes stop_codon:yes gene_type:complete
MEDKAKFLQFAISKFTEFGSKRFTLDDLAREMGISKKTIYQHFINKEAIVCESLVLLLDKIKLEILQSVENEKSNPILGVISIYRIGLNYLKTFNPTFLFGLKKYYPKANEEFINFRKNEINELVRKLLEKAAKNGHIRNNVNLDLTSELYLNRLEFILFTSNNLFERYSKKELLEHLIINNIRGIATQEYLKENNLAVDL